MNSIKVGIAYEGGNDGLLVATIVRKIIEPYGYTFEDFEPSTPGTSILGFIPSYTKRFIAANVDLGIYCTDQDNDSESRRSIIYNKIKETDETFLLKSAIAVPVPHIEAWLIIQDSVVKNLLGIKGELALPHAELPPKDRLTSLYSDCDSYTKTKNDLRVDIARLMDIDQCCRQSNDFKYFVQNIRSIMGRMV